MSRYGDKPKLTRVLFVRVDTALLTRIDALVEKLREKSPNPISRSAVIRDILWDGVNAELKAWEEGGDGP